MRYGREDVSGPEQCPDEGRLPGEIAMQIFQFLDSTVSVDIDSFSGH